MMPQNSNLDLAHWHGLMQSFGFAENNIAYDRLIAAYSEKHRAYHTLEHIAACFRHLDEVASQLDRPHEVRLALWFHDVIYNPFSAKNEEDSAQLAKEFLELNQASADVTSRVEELIILTKEHSAPAGVDGQFMLDIDLSILGTRPEIYAQFEKDVRREYKRVPSFIFKKKRKEVLQGFLNRPRLYYTDYFFARLEARAKTNLSWAIEQL